MKFLCWLWAPAWILGILALAVQQGVQARGETPGLAILWALYSFAAFWVTVIYAIGRVWRKSQRDSSQA